MRQKKTLKKILRELFHQAQSTYKLVKNYFYDMSRFYLNSSANGKIRNKIHLKSWIEADYHKIEKGLALPNPHPLFGIAVIKRMIENLELYIGNYGGDRTTHIAIETLKEYSLLNKKVPDYTKLHLQDSIDYLQKCSNFYDNKCKGGTIDITKEEILSNSMINLENFFYSRHSIRNFSTEDISLDLLNRAIFLARKTPTVCNRQSLKVRFYKDKDKDNVLKLQQGNSGFGHCVNTALIVTSDIRTFFSVGERNQCWVDGGLFSMSLIYALHSLGLGTCCLNWCAEKDADQRLHKLTSIPNYEVVIMMIAIGHLPEKLKVAESIRHPVDELLIKGTTISS